MTCRARARIALVTMLCALVTGALGPAVAASATLAPDVEARVAAAAPQERIPLLVVLRAQVDASAYGGDPAALVQALRATAAATQPAVADDLSGRSTGLWLVNAIATQATSEETRALAADPRVETIMLDLPIQAASASVPVAAALRVTATAGNPLPAPVGEEEIGSWGVESVLAPAVWAQGVDGRGVTVASIDTGVDPSNPDLAGRVVAWRDFVNGRTSPYDDDGHGSHTIGTMIGSARSGGPIGIAPGARVMVAKAIARGGPTSGSLVLRAAQWLADPDGDPSTADQPDVIANSWAAGGSATDVWFRPMVRAWIALGIVPVFAAGNTGTRGLPSPASYPEAIAVGAIEPTGQVAPFSARGPVVWTDPDGTGPVAGSTIPKPDLVAPGVGILSSDGHGWQVDSGTSMAAPHVAGVVALMRQADPEIPAQRIADILRATARDGGPTGWDPGYGAGLVDAAAAVGAVRGIPIPLAAPARISLLEVPRTVSLGRRTLVVSARLSAPGALRVELRGPGTIRSSHDGPADRALVRVARTHESRLSVGLPLRGLRPGGYRLVARVGAGRAIVRRVSILDR